MQIAFATSGLPFHGNSLTETAMGGSETALISLTQALRDRGHDVSVYCNCPRPGDYSGIRYHRQEDLVPHNLHGSLDVLVASRWPDYLTSPVPAGLRVLWCHDMCPTGDAVKGWVSKLFQTDAVFVLSDFHAANYDKNAPEISKILWKTNNAIDLDFIADCRRPKVPGKLIYTSRPERGLLFLLTKVMPELIKKRPDLKLYVSTYSLQGMQVSDELKNLYAQCDYLCKTLPFVVHLGSLRKDQLYNHISSSELLLYPTDFPEISCITAMEAMACHTPMITTDAFALSETLDPDLGQHVAFSGELDAAYLQKFVSACDDYFVSGLRGEDYGDIALKSLTSRGYTWESVAEQWEVKFRDAMRKRLSSKAPAIVRSLYNSGDVRIAKELERSRDAIPAPSRISDITGDSRILHLEKVPHEYRVALQGRFLHGVELLKISNLRPKRVLEFDAGSISPGVALAQWLPDAEVVVMPGCENALRLLEPHAERRPNLRVVAEALPEGEKFDLLILHENFETFSYPIGGLREIQNQYLADGGHVLLFTRKDHSQTQGRKDQLWNFDIRDLADMFGECENYGTSVCELPGDGHPSTSFQKRSSHCVTLFRKLEIYGNVDIQEKLMRTRPHQSLAVCMIASNEEDWISGAIKSVQPIADRIIVQLNNSTDCTEAICQSLGAEVRHCEFDNFSQVRNLSKEGVDEDWILWLDADERLVNNHNIDKYLHSTVFNGFAIRQNHLMLDMPKSHDLPVRLFRNRPQYKFVGYIHEHCEDTAENPFDDAIFPVLILSDVDIAHYGYSNERVRRGKCSSRNLALLLRDLQDNGPKRKLTWVLVIRDYLNMVKWSFEKSGSRIVEEGSFEHSCVASAVATYINHFELQSHRYETLAFPMYQEALEILGKSGLPFDGQKHPPFEIGLTLFGAVSGLEDTKVAPSTRWFRSANEYVEFMADQVHSMAHGIGVTPDKGFSMPRDLDVRPEPPHVELLSRGVNLFGAK